MQISKNKPPKPRLRLRASGSSGDLKRYQNPCEPSTLSPQKNIRGLVGQSRIVKSAFSDVKVDRIANLRPLPTLGRELSFRGPFDYSAGSLRVSSMGLCPAPSVAQNVVQSIIPNVHRQWGF